MHTLAWYTQQVTVRTVRRRPRDFKESERFSSRRNTVFYVHLLWECSFVFSARVLRRNS